MAAWRLWIFSVYGSSLQLSQISPWKEREDAFVRSAHSKRQSAELTAIDLNPSGTDQIFEENNELNYFAETRRPFLSPIVVSHNSLLSCCRRLGR